MNEAPESCREWRERIQERMDDRLSAEHEPALRGHLGHCEACRDYESGLAAVRRALRSMPVLRFPDDALDAVRRRTVGRARDRMPAARWWPLAAAAALALALLVPWLAESPDPEPASPVVAGGDADAALAAHRTRRLLGYVGGALRRTEDAAIRDVLAGEVSPALQRIPVRIPGLTARTPRRSGT